MKERPRRKSHSQANESALTGMQLIISNNTTSSKTMGPTFFFFLLFGRIFAFFRPEIFDFDGLRAGFSFFSFFSPFCNVAKLVIIPKKISLIWL